MERLPRPDPHYRVVRDHVLFTLGRHSVLDHIQRGGFEEAVTGWFAAVSVDEQLVQEIVEDARDLPEYDYITAELIYNPAPLIGHFIVWLHFGTVTVHRMQSKQEQEDIFNEYYNWFRAVYEDDPEN